MISNGWALALARLPAADITSVGQDGKGGGDAEKGFPAGEPLTGWPEFIAAPGDIWARCKNCISDLRLSALSSASLAELCNLSLSLNNCWLMYSRAAICSVAFDVASATWPSACLTTFAVSRSTVSLANCFWFSASFCNLDLSSANARFACWIWL